jgi:glutamate-ammonia-ligase adenylyltransferase
MPSLLESIAFREPTRARRELASVDEGLPFAVQEQIEVLLAAAPDPDRAVRYAGSLKQQHSDAFRRMAAHPATLHHLITIFSYSHFLSDEILQNPQWIEQFGDLDIVLSAEEYAARLASFLGPAAAGTPPAFSLALFRRQQILRILLRDVLGFCSLSETTEELSNLADAILDVSYRGIRAELIARHGTPRYTDEAGIERECGMAVIALGKLGGGELNYSSDIDLMFVYTANGTTSGPNQISNKEFYKKVANQYTELLSTYTSEGMCYRVDLRLRPDGSLGEACISLDGAKRYYQSRARDWELQMLIKGRAAAGDRETGRQLLDCVEPLIYSTTLDFSAVEAVSATRERIGEKLNKRKPSRAAFDIKLAPGGIRDIEFLVQCLQRLHGGRVPWVRHGGTLLALSRLSDKDLLSASEYGRLASAYRFLRNLEHRLQFADDRQTHTLPTDAQELDLLAAKMPVAQLGSTPSGDRLLNQLNGHLEAVQEIYERVIHSQRPSYYSGTPAPAGIEAPDVAEPPSSNLIRFLDQRAPELGSAVARSGLARGARAFEHFLEKVLPNTEWLSLLNSNATTARHTLDIFEHSPYFAEELIRTPELIDDLRELSLAPREHSFYASLTPALEDASDLRRSFRREMFRIQAASIGLRAPVFQTLEQTSDLADAAIAGAYRLAIEQVTPMHSPGGYEPRNRMMAIALGRLGMREFDLASDADLVFILPDEDHAQQLFWTRVANRMIDLLTAYTSSGLMFAVDTRLRPNGGAGALVQSESSYKEYFAKNAEAWEGIAYMKSRAVAGDLERATSFLNELQKVDWRRYGQSGRSKKDLRQMRMRLEKEQGPGNPLKAGLGGFYDIDFSLLYLRLKGAGIFFKVLNTPARIDIIEAMGHLERADAEFLRDAATFYRAVDHALRVYSGHAEGSLPNSERQLEVVTELVHRWTPEHLNHQPLKTELAQIKNRTREIFDRLFA